MSATEPTDHAIVDALVAGDVSALADTYDRYADALFTYARGMLGSHDAAADTVHDSLLIATQRITQLRDPAKFRPWLYAIVRSECLRHLRQGKRSVHLPDDVEFVMPGDEPVDDIHQREMCALVAAAAAGLSPKDREVLELSIRHDLDNAQVAAVLGISANQASTVTTRARDQLERSLSVLMVARDPDGACPELASMTATWDGVFTPLWRKRIGRHMDKCATCSATKERRFRAEAILVVLPLFAAPVALRDRIVRHNEVQLVSFVSTLASHVDPLDSEGFPAQPDSGQRRVAPVWKAAAAALLVIGAIVAVVLVTPSTEPTTATVERLLTTTIPTTPSTTTSTPSTTTSTPSTTVALSPPSPAPPPPTVEYVPTTRPIPTIRTPYLPPPLPAAPPPAPPAQPTVASTATVPEATTTRPTPRDDDEPSDDEPSDDEPSDGSEEEPGGSDVGGPDGGGTTSGDPSSPLGNY